MLFTAEFSEQDTANVHFALTTKEQLRAHMEEVPPQLPWHSLDYFSLNRKLLTFFPGIFRIPYLQEKPNFCFKV